MDIGLTPARAVANFCVAGANRHHQIGSPKRVHTPQVTHGVRRGSKQVFWIAAHIIEHELGILAGNNGDGIIARSSAPRFRQCLPGTIFLVLADTVGVARRLAEGAHRNNTGNARALIHEHEP